MVWFCSSLPWDISIPERNGERQPILTIMAMMPKLGSPCINQRAANQKQQTDKQPVFHFWGPPTPPRMSQIPYFKLCCLDEGCHMFASLHGSSWLELVSWCQPGWILINTRAEKRANASLPRTSKCQDESERGREGEREGGELGFSLDLCSCCSLAVSVFACWPQTVIGV